MPSYWVGKREGDEGGGTIRIIRRAEDDDVKGHPLRHGLDQADDVEGQMPWRHGVEPEGDDTIGHPWRLGMDPLDKEQGLYLVEVDSDEDVTGQGFRYGG